MAVSLQGRVPVQEPGGRSPIVSPGKVDRPSKRRAGAWMRQSRSCESTSAGALTWQAPRHVRMAAEQGVHAPA
jgi:hypothetical protein